MAFQLLKYPSDGALATAATADWLQQLRLASDKPGNRPYTVALSGGRIAKTFFSEIVRQALAAPDARPSPTIRRLDGVLRALTGLRYQRCRGRLNSNGRRRIRP